MCVTLLSRFLPPFRHTRSLPPLSRSRRREGQAAGPAADRESAGDKTRKRPRESLPWAVSALLLYPVFSRRSADGGVFLLDLLDALLLCLLRGIPPVFGHLLINAALHAQGAVERGMEGLVHSGGRLLDRAVQIQIAYALGGQEQIFHDLLVVHRLSSLHQLVERVEQLPVVVEQLLRLLLQRGIAQLRGGRAALDHQKLGVPQRVLDIEQFFGTHMLHLISVIHAAQVALCSRLVCAAGAKKNGQKLSCRGLAKRENCGKISKKQENG